MVNELQSQIIFYLSTQRSVLKLFEMTQLIFKYLDVKLNESQFFYLWSTSLSAKVFLSFKDKIASVAKDHCMTHQQIYIWK